MENNINLTPEQKTLHAFNHLPEEVAEKVLSVQGELTLKASLHTLNMVKLAVANGAQILVMQGLDKDGIDALNAVFGPYQDELKEQFLKAIADAEGEHAEAFAKAREEAEAEETNYRENGPTPRAESAEDSALLDAIFSQEG